MGRAESMIAPDQIAPDQRSPETSQHLLVFGASGSIGQAVCAAAAAQDWRVTGVARTITCAEIAGVQMISLDPLYADFQPELLRTDKPYTAICWAQGANSNDSVYDVSTEDHLQIYTANVVYILVTMKALLTSGLLMPATKMCIISSIWQNITRPSKLSYCISKAALQGLVLSASVDLAADGHLINAVLPGALDTPMTRRNLTPAQTAALASATAFGRLPTLADVASLVCYLCSKDNTGITGQFIAADLGFSHARLL